MDGGEFRPHATVENLAVIYALDMPPAVRSFAADRTGRSFLLSFDPFHLLATWALGGLRRQCDVDEVLNAFRELKLSGGLYVTSTDREKIKSFVAEYGLFVPFTPPGSPPSTIWNVCHRMQMYSSGYPNYEYARSELGFYDLFAQWQTTETDIEKAGKQGPVSESQVEALGLMRRACMQVGQTVSAGGKSTRLERVQVPLVRAEGAAALVEKLELDLNSQNKTFRDEVLMTALQEYGKVAIHGELDRLKNELPTVGEYGLRGIVREDETITKKLERLDEMTARDVTEEERNAFLSVMKKAGLDGRSMSQEIRYLLTPQSDTESFRHGKYGDNTARQAYTNERRRDEIRKEIERYEYIETMVGSALQVLWEREPHEAELLQRRHVKGELEIDTILGMKLGKDQYNKTPYNNLRRKALDHLNELCPADSIYPYLREIVKKRGTKAGA